MFSNTHAYIADKVSKYLEQYDGILIDNYHFGYGSIKPDYIPRLITIGHYEDESMDFIKDEIQYISNTIFPKDKNSLKQYSARLGVIIHYLCDYFCYAHNDKVFKDDLVKHLIYEAKLESTVGRFENEINKYSHRLSSMVFSRNAIDYINYKLEAYKHSNVSCFKDLTYAIEVSYMSCCSIICSSLNLRTKHAA